MGVVDSAALKNKQRSSESILFFKKFPVSKTQEFHEIERNCAEFKR